jgi:hypothetical protein
MLAIKRFRRYNIRASVSKEAELSAARKNAAIYDHREVKE